MVYLQKISVTSLYIGKKVPENKCIALKKAYDYLDITCS